MLVYTTFSVTARCARSGAFGVAVATRVPAVGSVVPHVRAGVGAIATQALTNPYIGIHGLDLLAAGGDAVRTRDAIAAWDPDIERRQFALVDAAGGVAAYTGAATHDHAGHRLGDGVVIAGNLLTGPEVLDAMVATYDDAAAPADDAARDAGGAADAFAAAELAFAERLLRTLEAGQAAGGDRRGKQSAALRVVRDEAYAFVDLRVDDHADPIPELRRLFGVWRELLLPYLPERPTRASLTARGAAARPTLVRD